MSDATKWEGLWNKRPGIYGSRVFRKKNLPDKFRIIVRYNKFYEKDSSRPRFVFCIADGDAAEAIELDMREYGPDLDQLYITPEEAWRIAVTQYDGRRDPYDVYTHEDFGGRPLRDILTRGLEEEQR